MLIESIGKEYQKSKINQFFRYCQKDQNFLDIIDAILNNMDKEYRRILYNDYFLPNKENNWYLNYYTRANYYKLRKKAIAEFLHCLEN